MVVNPLEVILAHQARERTGKDDDEKELLLYKTLKPENHPLRPFYISTIKMIDEWFAKPYLRIIEEESRTINIYLRKINTFFNGVFEAYNHFVKETYFNKR